MRDAYRVVVVGGGIVGASVLYHLARRGWADVALIERSELTAGSTWHAAAGFHAINEDPGVAELQHYTMGLYPRLEQETGRSVGLHMTGGLNLAGTPERWEWLKAEWAFFRTMDVDARLVERDEIEALCPIVDVSAIQGALYDPNEGHVDPHGATHAYAAAARALGAEVVLHNRVLALTPLAGGSWRLDTEQGPVVAEHVVNAAGLWARRVGRMAGVDLPLVPMQHHYLVTEDVPEIAALQGEMPAVTDLEGFTYLRQEHAGVLLGVYERNPRHWKVDGAEWDYGMELIPPEIERIDEELSIGFARFPALQEVGIRRWVNGALTFTPDGNPLVGPVPGLRNYWAACGSMAGFSQGGAMGLAVANWLVDGDPGADVFGMDVARFGPYATNDAYLRETTAQFYARRFVLAYPNEELPAGRVLATSPAYDALAGQGARFTAVAGLEVPAFFAPGEPGFEEEPALRRSAAERWVAEEMRATREHAGLFETAVYARYEVTGPGAEQWLDRLLAGRLPAPGRIRLAPMLNHAGRLMGDLTVTRLGEDRFWLTGSYHLQHWHMRWFTDRLPLRGVSLRNVSDAWIGFSLSGPRSREILAELTAADVSDAALPFFGCTEADVALAGAVVARISITGERGYEVTVPAPRHRALWGALTEAGAPQGMRQIGLRALDRLRLEKGYGVWSAEYTPARTPGASGLDRFVAFEKADFVGREAACKERDNGADERLVLLAVDAVDADALGFEPVWAGGRRVGVVTSGGYGHTVGLSLALAYVDQQVAADRPPLTVHVLGEERTARILPESPYDPRGERLRG